MKGRGLLRSHGRGQKGVKSLLNDQKKLWLEEYKELGLEFRHLDSQISATNRLMLPPLVIGLLVLYGDVHKFLGVEFKNPDAAHLLIWTGCLIISLIWVFNVSRLAQLIHSHLATRRENEPQLGLSGHTKIYNRDKTFGVRKILRHNILRLVGFGLYFFLLLLKLKSMNFNSVLVLEKDILIKVIVVSTGLPFLIWYYYFKVHFRSSWATPTERWNTKKGKFQDIKTRKSLINIMGWIVSIIIFVFFIFLILSLVDLREQPNANAHLMRGLQFSASGDYDKAIEAYDKAIKIKPDYAKAYALRGEAHRATGNDEHSKSDLAISNALCKE